jgi:hypothetical protein
MFTRIIKFFFRPIIKKIDKINTNINEKADLLLRVASYNTYSNNHCRDKVIYTCISGGYDNLIQHNYINFDYDYVCYTDNTELLKIKSYGVWKIKSLEYTESDNVRINRWHKIHPHILFPDYKESIYLDGNIDMRTNILFTLIKDFDIIRIPIHNGTCIYEECGRIIKSGKDTKDRVEKIINYLKIEGFPKNYGLNENCIIYRKHNDNKIIEMMNMWWYFIENYSKRDQLSLSFVLWKFNISPYNISFPNVRNDDTNFIFYGKH